MAVNELSFNQISTILKDVVDQATGKQTLIATDTSSFVTQATTALKTGYDPIFGALNQVLSRSIFSTRPYRRKFGNLEVTESAFGNHVRKFAIVDSDPLVDSRYATPVTDTPKTDAFLKSSDQQVQAKPTPVQTNFYGSNVYQRAYTIYKDQLECAFRSPDEFAQFVSMVVQNNVDNLEQYRESIARATLANYVGGILAEGDGARVINVLERYNALTGLGLTRDSVFEPTNYKAFVQWFYSFVAQVSSMMTERSQRYQTTLTGKPINRHTPYQDQRLYMLAQNRYENEMMALADVYHDSYLKMIDVQTLNFWQSIDDPAALHLTASYTAPNGNVATKEIDTNTDNVSVIGALFDREALGYATTQQWSNPAPFNARGGYTTFWFHETERNWNDFTEKGVVFVM